MVAAFAAIGLLAFLLVRSRTTASVPVERGDAAQASRCTSSSACTRANGGAPSRCREDGACAVLASEDCVVHAGAGVAESDDTVWFGAMLPPKGDPSGDGEAELRAIDLARQDFDQMMSGFTRLRGDAYAQVHPFGVIACDDTKDAMRAGRHLVEDVRVPAIIGFRSAAEIIDVGSALLVPNGVVAVASLSTSPLVTVLPNRPDQPRLVWRTTYSSAETAKAMGHIVPDLLEPQIRATPGVLAASAPMRVALVRMTSRGGSTFNELLFKALRYNGKSALENGTDFRELVFDETDPSKVDGDAKQLVVALDRFAPHVIILVADQGMRIIEPLERAWTHASYRPRYLFMTPLTQALLDWMGSSLERRRRFFGLATLSTTSVNARFVMHYNEGATTKVTRTYAPNSSYDAFYVLAYATYALREKPVTGTNLARAIARLVPPGKTFDVGPADIFDAYSALRRGENIDLNGATGSLDFDLDTGEAPFDQAVLCAALDDKGRPVDSVESGVVFHSSPSRLEGTLRCP